MPTSAEIRQQFIDFFVKKHGHTFVPSSPVVPHDDPTLLFANAGMNQFKPYFLGTEKPPYRRVANTQKCIRAGGKHNDLDDVGKDTYHHTFFEMLGNWSFGDYFKKEAIAWAWELLTDVWKLDPTRLHVTVFEGDPQNNVPRDDEAAGFWRAAGVPDDHIHLGNKKDNFWEMGDTGPCGPCTEVHYDKTPDRSGAKLVNQGTDQVIEIWNLVFIQFNRNADKSLTPLPAQHVDTGMGFERITAVLQGKSSNYDTDVFAPIFAAIQKTTGAPPYTGKLDDLKDTAYRVIADHIRTLTFAITDGAIPDRKERGSQLRSILRRAERYGWQMFGMREPFLFKLVDSVVNNFGNAFPELMRDPEKVRRIIKEEEISFLRTLEKGIDLFYDAAGKAILKAVAAKRKLKPIYIAWDTTPPGEHASEGELPAYRLMVSKLEKPSEADLETVQFPADREEQQKFIREQCASQPVIWGERAFTLHTEQGVYIDILEQMAAEAGLRVDRQDYERLFKEFQGKSGEGQKKLVISAIQGDLPKTDDSLKYNHQPLAAKAKVLGWVKDNAVISAGKLNDGDEAAVLLDRTAFYAEQGGQVGDTGVIQTPTGSFDVQDTQKLGESVLHVGRVFKGHIEAGQSATFVVRERGDTMRNHTATHLLNFALRQVLGDDVQQKGSLVDAEKTRFDFNHDKPLTAAELAEVEKIVNERVCFDLPVTPVTLPLAEAKQLDGVRAVFGEKYPDPVRVLMIGAEKPADASADISVEFCGGTHVQRTGQIGFFKIVGQELVSKGVRRLTAVTGTKAVEHMQKLTGLLDELGKRFNCAPDDLPARVESLQEQVKELTKQLQKGVAGDLNAAGDKLLDSALSVGSSKLIVGEVPAAPVEQLRAQVDRLRQKAGSALIVLGWKADEGGGFLVGVSDDLIKKGIKAGDLIKQVAAVADGKGGGPPNLASAGCKDPSKLGAALQKALELGKEALSR
jgi:alanyl-tRNA synthetase